MVDILGSILPNGSSTMKTNTSSDSTSYLVITNSIVDSDFGVLSSQVFYSYFDATSDTDPQLGPLAGEAGSIVESMAPSSSGAINNGVHIGWPFDGSLSSFIGTLSFAYRKSPPANTAETQKLADFSTPLASSFSSSFNYIKNHDARGFARGDSTDIGAHEVDGTPPQ